MSFMLYVDENTDTEIAARLSKGGIDVLRCQDAGTMGLDDESHLITASTQGRVVLTRDQDFLRLNQEWSRLGKPHAGIIFITPERNVQVNTIINKIIDWHKVKSADEMRNLVWFV